MALNKIRQANRKWRHERKRRIARMKLKRQKEAAKRKTKEMFEDIKSRQVKRRADEMSYIESIKQEVGNEEQT